MGAFSLINCSLRGRCDYRHGIHGMRAASIEQMAALLRWIHLPVLVIWVAIVCFVRFYFNAGRLWLAWTVCGLRTLALLLKLHHGAKPVFQGNHQPQACGDFWRRDNLHSPGCAQPLVRSGPAQHVGAGRVCDGRVGNLVAPEGGNRPPCLDFQRQHLVLPAGMVVHAALVNAGIINSPYIAGFSFMPTIIRHVL